MAPSQLPEQSIDTDRREEGKCPVCGLSFVGRQRVETRDGDDMAGRAYIHDEYLCGEWSDGVFVEDMGRRDFPANVE